MYFRVIKYFPFLILIKFYAQFCLGVKGPIWFAREQIMICKGCCIGCSGLKGNIPDKVYRMFILFT